MKIELSNSTMKNLIIVCSFVFVLCIAYHYLTQPHSYEDCILTNLKSDSPMAVGFIDDMCEAKFPR